MTDLPGLRLATGEPSEQRADALILGLFEGGIETPGTQVALQSIGYDGPPRIGGFSGKIGDVATVSAPGLAVASIVFVGLGPVDRFDDDAARRASGVASRHLATIAKTAVSALPLVHPSSDTTRAVAEGALLGAYRYTDVKTDPKPTLLERITLVVPARHRKPAKAAIARAAIHAAAIALARDLVNTPPDRKRPPALADLAVELLQDTCTVEVWDERKLKRRGYGGMIGVGRGSSAPPRLVIATYTPEHPVGHIALVGKGITYDSGGLSLKRPNDNLLTMKLDMGGAAAVIAAMSALAALNVRVKVTGIAALAENMPDGDAQRPGDVITIANGTTVEVLNTDAEGRLVLADALSHAVKLKPDAIVDLATLTGAVTHAVGENAIGMMGTDEDLVRQLLTAAGEAGEPMWRLPLWEDLRHALDSPVADLNNLGRGVGAGSTMGGLFLREFTGGLPWAHLDTAAAIWKKAPSGHLSKGGTGSGVGTLLHWLESAST